MPEDRPNARELIETVREFVDALRPFLGGYGAFQARVAANLLAIAQRELELGPDAERAERERLAALLGRHGDPALLEAELVRWIRQGDLSEHWEPLLEHLRASARERLRIANPKYLAASERERAGRSTEE